MSCPCPKWDAVWGGRRMSSGSKWWSAFLGHVAVASRHLAALLCLCFSTGGGEHLLTVAAHAVGHSSL